MSGPGSIVQQPTLGGTLRQHRNRIRADEGPNPGRWIYVVNTGSDDVAPATTPDDFVLLFDATSTLINPVFQNSWTNVAGKQPLSFRIHPTTRVAMRGAVAGGDIPSVVFTLPDGYRPPNSQSVVFPSDDGSSVFTGRIDPSGDVWLLEENPGSGGTSDVVDDCMVLNDPAAAAADKAAWATTINVSSIPQDRCYLEVIWTVAVQEFNVLRDAHHAFITVQFNDDVTNQYFSRVDVLDPSANGQPFVNFDTASANSTANARPWIIIGFLNDYNNSIPLGYASGRFVLPNYAVPYNSAVDRAAYNTQTIGKQLMGQAVLGGANTDPTADFLVQGAWSGPDNTDPPAITKMSFKVWDYTTIAGPLVQMQFGPGTRFTTVGPTMTGDPRIVNDGVF